MKVRYLGESDSLELLNGKVYEVTKVVYDGSFYSVIDETGDDYLYPADQFEIVEP